MCSQPGLQGAVQSILVAPFSQVTPPLRILQEDLAIPAKILGGILFAHPLFLVPNIFNAL